MKTKTYLISGLALLMIAVFGGCSRFSQQQDSENYDCGWRQKFRNKDFSEHILRKMDRHVEELNLTASQKNEYSTLRGKIKSDLKQMKETRKNLFSDLRHEINRSNPDLTAVADLVTKGLSRMPDRVQNHVDYFVEFYNILDENQKNEVISGFRKKLNRIPL